METTIPDSGPEEASFSNQQSEENRWLPTQRLLTFANHVHGFDYRLKRRLPGGYAGGAYLITSKSRDAEAVFKWNAQKSYANKIIEAARVVESARAANWPTPKWLAFGESPSGYPYVIQEFVPRVRTIRGVTINLLKTAVDFIEKHHARVGLGAVIDWTARDYDIVFDEKVNVKYAQPLTDFSATGAALVEMLAPWTEPFRGLFTASNDLVHGDFQPENILVTLEEDFRIVAVVDVEAVGKGSRLHDIAGLVCHNIIWGGDKEALVVLDAYAKLHAGPGEWQVSLAARFLELLSFAIECCKSWGTDAKPILVKATDLFHFTRSEESLTTTGLAGPAD